MGILCCWWSGDEGGGRELDQVARYLYGFTFFLTKLLAWAIRDYNQNALTRLHCK